MDLKRMSLEHGKVVDPRPGDGHDVIGMISVYLVTLANGEFFVSEHDGEAITSPVWSESKLMFAFVGLSEAREIAKRFGGQVCIMNCTKPMPYLN